MFKTKLGELLTIKQGYAFKSENYVDKSDYALITLANISDSNNFKIEKEKITYYGAEFPKEYLLNEGDLVMPLTEQAVGLFGNTAFIPKIKGISNFVLNQRVGKVIPKTGKVDKYYLHYLLATENVKRQLEYRASGTRQRNISADDIYDVDVWIPSIENQIKIGKILYEFEKKINNNNEINFELSTIVKTIYDYWFLQFDFPDKSGNPYKSSGGKMIWSDDLKREIPEGWRVATLNDCVEDILDRRGVTPKKLGGDWVENGIKALSAKCIKNGKLINLDQANQVSEEMYKRWMTKDLQDGDILMTSEAPLGEFYFILNDEKFCLSQRLFAIRSNSKVKPIYLYYELSHGYGNSQIMGSKSGSTVFGIRQDELRKINILIPSKEIQEAFEKSIIDMYRRIRINDYENRELIKLREFLLPLLMNGQIGFKEE